MLEKVVFQKLAKISDNPDTTNPRPSHALFFELSKEPYIREYHIVVHQSDSHPSVSS